MAKELIKYVSSDPSSLRVAVYRIVLVVIAVAGLLGVVYLRNQVQDNTQTINRVATAVAPAPAP